MSHNKSALCRYRVIDALLRNPMRTYPSMRDIIEACHRKLDIWPSPETIQKDIAVMRLPQPEGFDAPIRYNRTRSGYEYTDPDFELFKVPLRQEEIDAIIESVDIIRIIGGTRIGERFSHAVEKIRSTTLERTETAEGAVPVLQTMLPPVSRGFEHFDLLYEASKEQVPVSFLHFSYKKRAFNHIFLHPFLIKEFDNRWYVAGYSEQHQEVRTFGLDRISAPMPLKIKYQPTPAAVVKAYFYDVYGVFPLPGRKKELVKIYVSPLATHYFQAYPIHESQRINKESAGDSVVTFELIPSVELARYFLAQGRHVKILQPRWFNNFTRNLVS